MGIEFASGSVDNDSVKNSDKKCCENSDNNTIQAVEVVR